ncbi:hypothetical protein cyc_00928 [Cyclospora cayetanensis]|uniref:Transmembrane protein n=1 Tax=Cyclospora cayetanensis TaxID=88456 RepID=A0A1D3D4Z5_9EIME|nr:hypothetical protein cyc_00928 [Cyclospora cayetanensis]
MQYTAQPAAPHARASRLPERVEASGEKQMQAIKEEKQGQNELNGGVEECTSLQAAEHHMKSAGSSDFSDSPRCGASQTAGGPSPPPATSAQFVTPVSTPRSFRGLPPATMPPRGSYFEGCVSTRVNQGEAGRRVDGPMPCTPLDRSRRLLMTTNKRGTPIPRKKENRHDGGGGSETWDAPGLLGFFREELMLLQERLEGCFSALRSGALSLASFSKWAILFFFVALLVLGCTLVCFSIVGHSLASLEEPVAFATVPFSNRSWELLPGDEAMFAAPAPLISSHWPSQQQQHMQDLQQMQPMQQLEEETKLPEFTVDLILSLSVSGALNNSSSHRHRAPNTLHPADEVGRTSAQQEALLACEEALPPQEEKAALEQPPTAEGLYEGWILREPDFSSFGNGGQQNLVGQCKNEASSSPEAPTLRLRAVGRRRSTTAS